MSKAEDTERYEASLQGMQAGVAMEQAQGSKCGTPKHLRTGVNAAMADHSGLVSLLILKGVITEEEYLAAIADSMEFEKERYEIKLSKEMGTDVRLR